MAFSSRAAPSASITTGGGCPPHATVSRKRPPPSGFSLAKSAVRNWPARLSSRTARLRAPSTAAGESCECAAARTVWRASAVSAAASTPLPQTSPIATPHVPSREREGVVEVAADLDALGAGLQPAGEIDPGHLRQRARQQ